MHAKSRLVIPALAGVYGRDSDRRDPGRRDPGRRDPGRRDEAGFGTCGRAGAAGERVQIGSLAGIRIIRLRGPGPTAAHSIRALRPLPGPSRPRCKRARGSGGPALLDRREIHRAVGRPVSAQRAGARPRLRRMAQRHL